MKSTVALLLLLPAVAGCAHDAPQRPCVSLANCLLDADDEPLTVLVHASNGLALDPWAWNEFVAEVARVFDREVHAQAGAAVPELPQEVDEVALHALHPVGGDPAVLHVYLVNATHWVGDQPASGLSFPGEAPVFLFPATMDLRVGQAGLDDTEASIARIRLETIILTHEFGHALGLVGCGLPMVRPHDDPDLPCHSANATSLMHARVARVAQWPTWYPAVPLSPFAWDADDLADLAAHRASLAS